MNVVKLCWQQVLHKTIKSKINSHLKVLNNNVIDLYTAFVAIIFLFFSKLIVLDHY